LDRVRIIFVGEQRSKTAIKRDWTWFDKRLCSKTLRVILDDYGLDLDDYTFINLFDDEGKLDLKHLHNIQSLGKNNWTIVSLGRRVERSLNNLGVRNTYMIHPAARGNIRKTSNYRTHVYEVLSSLK
jgi:hypothetical protein